MGKLHPKDLKVGDVFYECDHGLNIEVQVITQPTSGPGHKGSTKWSWMAVNTQSGATVDYVLTEGFEHYGPHIYSEPVYPTVVNGVVSYRLMGE